jgi:hypothetical protein
VDLNWYWSAQGGQVYSSFPFSKDSLVKDIFCKFNFVENLQNDTEAIGKYKHRFKILRIIKVLQCMFDKIETLDFTFFKLSNLFF